MQLSITPTAVTAAPVAWLAFEERGPRTSHAGRWEQTVLEMWADNDGRALLTDGRMTYPHDPGTVEDYYESVPWLVRDGVDAEAAQEDARRGAALLAAAVGRALPHLAEFAIAKGSRPDRDPEQLDLWVHTQDGERARYLVPLERAPQALLDARAALRAFAATIRRDFDRQLPSRAATLQGWTNPPGRARSMHAA